MQDNIYKKPISAIKPFEFDDRVADVFPDMISRSVPGYSASFELISAVSKQYAQNNTHLYDLGCSLGAATLAMRHSVDAKDCEIVAVDNSPAMIQRCEKLVKRDHAAIPVNVKCDDIENIAIQNASIAVMNYTLQFIPQEKRIAVLKKIHTGLAKGGALLLSEKIILADETENKRLIELHHQFKRLNGYNELEIAQKRSAIENVLIPETQEQHITRLQSVGFSTVQQVSQNINFVSFLAIA